MLVTLKLIIAFFFFGSLETLFPLKPKQKRFRQGWLTDIAHFFINHFIVKIVSYIIALVLFILLQPLISLSLQEGITSQPSWLQFIEAFLIAELSFYIIHRLEHTLPWLWNFHVIHHSSTELDWLASVRFHPLEMIIANVAVAMPLCFLGFTKETLGQYLIFGAILTLFNHANTSLRVPILRWIIATPEFHHWHHSKEQVAHNKNFSGFPLIDLLFGTFYLPQSKMPLNYGVDEFIPQTYGEQILYPIKIKKDVRIQILKLLELPIFILNPVRINHICAKLQTLSASPYLRVPPSAKTIFCKADLVSQCQAGFRKIFTDFNSGYYLYRFQLWILPVPISTLDITWEGLTGLRHFFG